MSYADFLARKALTVAPVGFEPTDYTANLFQFQRDIVALACKLGRFCVWADCGMDSELLARRAAEPLTEIMPLPRSPLIA